MGTTGQYKGITYSAQSKVGRIFTKSNTYGYAAYTQPKWSNKAGMLDVWLSVYSSSTSFFLV